MHLDHDQGEDGEAFVRIYEVQHKECRVLSIDDTDEVFEFEEETFVESMELADIGFVKIERFLSKYGIKEGKDEQFLTEEEREEHAMYDLIMAADYLQ